MAFKEQLEHFIDDFKNQSISELRDSVESQSLNHKTADFERGIHDELSVIYQELDSEINKIQNQINEYFIDVEKYDEDVLNERIQYISNLINDELKNFLVDLYDRGCESIENYKTKYFEDLII